MIPVPIAAVGLIAQQELCVLVTKNGGQPLCCRFDLGPREPDPAGRVRVEDRPVATVGVAKALDAVHAENACAREQFVHAGVVVLVAHASVRRGHEDYPMPRRDRSGDRASGEDHLVVGMSVKGDECCHGYSLATGEASRVG